MCPVVHALGRGLCRSAFDLLQEHPALRAAPCFVGHDLRVDVSSAESEAECHRSRIGCKRLRYLLEPLRQRVADAAAEA